ncbi:hypothetical protein KUF71_022636 [Frankliniella fusca]|uniref:Bromo domain-containing protein n=1 Tax=Frankliniella fusca TaxID=407009 RepID=A0AAE1H1S4_9NEOP|nr:hypothetical protein KUF71_022636 [Frankliniella fusca]
MADEEASASGAEVDRADPEDPEVEADLSSGNAGDGLTEDIEVAPELVWSDGDGDSDSRAGVQELDRTEVQEDSRSEAQGSDPAPESAESSPASHSGSGSVEAFDEDSSGSSGSDSDAPSPCARRTRQRGRQDRSESKSSKTVKAAGEEEQEPESDEGPGQGLSVGYRILQDLLNTNSTFLHYPEAKKGMIDYHDVIETPMWFGEIQRRFDDKEYLSIVDFVKDVRLLLLNTYRYFGPNALQTKRALRIEQVFEHKLSVSKLSLTLKRHCSLMSTHGIKTQETDSEGFCVRKAGEFSSYLLESVRGEKEERDKNRRESLNKERLLNKEGKGKEILKWETDVLLAPPALSQMRTMWEIPLIGHLIQLTVQVLCIDQIPQYEVERMFLMPQASKSLAILMTSLLSPPIQRPKLQSLPPMPYSIWSQKLSQRVATWYKMFQSRNHDWLKVFELCGIEKEFWNILGDWNQLEDYEFHELSFHQRVWLVKSLCDFQVHSHKTMQDALADHSLREQNCEVLGEDRHGRQYLHFPQFCWSPGLCSCIRVYRCLIPTEKARSPDFSEEAPLVRVRTGKGDFLPIWLKGRGRSKGKGGSISKRKMGAKINEQKFLSRLVYRMPNGMYIRGGKRRGSNRLHEPASSASISPRKQSNSNQTSNSTEATPSSNETTSDLVSKTLGSEEAIGDSSSSSRRQTRSRRHVSQGFYADWSDSDSVSTASPSSTPAKKSSQNSKSLSKKAVSSKNKKSELPLQTGDSTPLRESDMSENDKSEDGEASKSLDDCHESLVEEDASRSEWSTPALNGKREDCGEDSDEGEEEEKDERCQSKKDENDFNLADEYPWMPTDNQRQKRPHFNPDWLLLGAEHFELVADSVEGIRNLIDSLCEEDDNVGLIQRLKNSSGSFQEEKLEQRLQELISETCFFEVKMESNARKLRWKLFHEWEEFKNKPLNGKDDAELHWLKIFESGLEVHESLQEVKVKVEMKEDKSTDNLDDAKNVKTENCAEPEPQAEHADDESETGCDIRHSLRAKKPKIDNPQHNWMSSDSEEESDEDEEDAWEMPSRRKKKKPATGRSRKNKKDDDESNESTNPRKEGNTTYDVTKNFSFEAGLESKESSQNTDSPTQNKPIVKQPKMNQKLLPNKLTLDKEGNMFITLGCGTKVQLGKDDEGRIIVPEGHAGLSMINGKTLDQLVGSGKVVQKKKRKSARPVDKQSTTLFPSEPQPTNRSTTLFPAVSQPGGVVQAKEWTPPVVNTYSQDSLVKPKVETSIQAKEWTPPLGTISSSVSVTTGSTAPLKTYSKRKNIETQKHLSVTRVVPQTQTKKQSEPEEVVVLSDGSDDSIEVIKETEPKTSKQNGVPRIESVIGNASVDFAPKPLTKSVTMTPVFKPKNQPPSSCKNKTAAPWNPVISKTVSLEPAPSSSRVPPPGAPEVVITPAKKVQNRRTLQQTGVFQQPNPNQSFVSINPVPMRQAQQQFVPVNQVLPVTNQFQPLPQVVNMNNQYIVANPTPFAPMGSSYLVNAAPTYHYVPMAQTPGPLPLPVSAFDLGLPPGLRGQIVLANGDNNQFSYAFKLDDGGLIFLSSEQVSKIRAANGGKLTTMIQLQTH